VHFEESDGCYYLLTPGKYLKDSQQRRASGAPPFCPQKYIRKREVDDISCIPWDNIRRIVIRGERPPILPAPLVSALGREQLTIFHAYPGMTFRG